MVGGLYNLLAFSTEKLHNVCTSLGKPEGSAHMGANTTKGPDHRKLYSIAEQQAGYFTAKQAADAGFSWERLSDHASVGRFVRVARGIYRLAQFPSSPFEDLFVAWLRCGPKAVVSHESALSVYNLSDVLPGEIHVTVPRSASRRRKGIRQHTNRLQARDITKREGLPVTTVPRTIADVSKAMLDEEQVGRAVQEAIHEGLTDKGTLLSEANRRGGRAERLIKKFLGKREAKL